MVSTTKTMPRAWVLACCAICGGITGAIYMWSIFRNPLVEATGMDVSTVTFAYSFFLICVLIGQLITGPLLKVMKMRTLIGIGGIGFGLGWFLTGFASTPFELYLFFSVIGGLSDGFLYNSTVSVALKWFPDKRGFASGVCTGCMGLAPLIFAPFGNMLIENLSVFYAFQICGGIFLIVRIVFGWFVKDPPEGYLPKGWTQAQQEESVDGPSVTTAGMFKRPRFYLLWAIFVMAAISGQLVTGHASAIGQEQCGLLAAEGASLVAIMAVASFAGRMIFGVLADKIGCLWSLSIALFVTAVDMLFFMGATDTYVSFMAAIIAVGICFGGVMSILPTIVSMTFGAKYFSNNLPFVYSGYTFASFVGPMVAAFALETSGNYQLSYLISGALALCGIVVVIALIAFDRAKAREAEAVLA